MSSVKLLSTGNTKTVKGESRGFLTFILHLAPARLSGFNLCPKASAGCKAGCLNTAGRGRFDKTQAARIRKSIMFIRERKKFMALLESDIRAAERKASRMGLIPVVRLNGTSDIRWENTGIMEKFPHIQFYDYTKISNRKNIPANYHLTFSRSENNDKAWQDAFFKNGMNVAVVFNTKKGKPLPKTYYGIKVVEGDDTDLRFLDSKRVIVGLRAKGNAKKDRSGFVVEVRND